jgi:hypothetical protein
MSDIKKPATPEDFNDWLQYHLDEASTQIAHELNRISGECAKHNALSSSRHYVQRGEVIVKGFLRGIDAALEQCVHARRVTPIDHDTLRRITEKRLEAFRDELKPRLTWSADQHFSQINAPRVAELDKKLAFALRQFDVGLLTPNAPKEPLTMTNTINIGKMSGGAIQQGTAHSDQSQSIRDSFNTTEATEALDKFAKALKTVAIPTQKHSEIEANIRTINAELAKANPSPTIVKEAGRARGFAIGAPRDHAGRP